MGVKEQLTAALADRYQIESEIDSGGMATVYRARDLKHERTVAIKVLRPDLAEAIGADRFLREIRTTANLSHPHILPLHDSGEAAGLLYYVMPFVEGESLRDRLEREGQLPVEDAVQIAREVADALAYAHDKGVIHRDIKPANIMLERGHALLADFGIAQAKASTDETRLTGMGMSLGTPAYMSPEQISGTSEVDGRSDQYAMACVLYEMLAGHPPFTGADIQTVMRQHLAAEAPKVTGARATVPTGVAKALHRGLAKTPADRYRTLAEFEKALAGATLPLLARIPMGRARVVGYAVVAMVVLAGVWAVGFRGRAGERGGPPPEVASQVDPNVIAVAPFRSASEDPELAELGDRLARSIQDRVSRAEIGDMVALDRVGPALRAAGPNADPVAVLASALGAGTVVMGTLTPIGDSVEVRVSCTDAAGGDVFHSLDPIRSHRDDPEAMVATIAAQVAGALAFFLDPFNYWVKAGSPPLNPEAYEAYRRGWNLLDHIDNWGEATEHFLQAWELDSLYVDAGLDVYTELAQSPQRARADSAFARLAGLEGRMTRGQRFSYDQILAWREGDREAAIRVLRDAGEVYPEAFAYELGHALLYQNRAQEALEAFQRLEVAPGQFLERYVRRWPFYFTQYAEALHRLGQHQKELEIVLEGQRRYPGRDLAGAELKARIALGQIQEARALMAELHRQDRWMDVFIGQREMFAHGQEEAVRDLLEEEVQRFETDPWYTEHEASSNRKAIVLHFLGRDVEALALFEEYLAQNPTSLNALGWVGITAPLAGDTARGREIEEWLTEMADTVANPYPYSWVRAQIRANMGDEAGAVRYLERAFFQEGKIWMGNEHHFFDLLRLRGYPPFDDLMRPKG